MVQAAQLEAARAGLPAAAQAERLAAALVVQPAAAQAERPGAAQAALVAVEVESAAVAEAEACGDGTHRGCRR